MKAEFVFDEHNFNLTGLKIITDSRKDFYLLKQYMEKLFPEEGEVRSREVTIGFEFNAEKDAE